MCPDTFLSITLFNPYICIILRLFLLLFVLFFVFVLLASRTRRTWVQVSSIHHAIEGIQRVVMRIEVLILPLTWRITKNIQQKRSSQGQCTCHFNIGQTFVEVAIVYRKRYFRGLQDKMDKIIQNYIFFLTLLNGIFDFVLCCSMRNEVLKHN